MLRTIWHGLLDLLYPAPVGCVYCGSAKTAEEFDLCAGCLSSIEFVTGRVCETCGKPVGETEKLCFDCSHQPREFEQGIPVALYRGWLKDAIYAFKFSGNRELAKPFARMMAGKTIHIMENIDCVVPVPMHAQRLRQRGFNHAALLAYYIGEFVDRPVYADVLLRVQDTLPQRTLKRLEREGNLRGAFTMNEGDRIHGKRVLLVDDIFTTGATVDICSKELRASGAKTVLVNVLAIGVDFSRISKNSGELFVP